MLIKIYFVLLSIGFNLENPIFFSTYHSLNIDTSCQIDSLSSDSVSHVKVLIPTFLGNEQRNYYGNEAPSRLDVIWKLYLGEGETVISRKTGTKKWKGAGWTGQPLLVSEDSLLYLIQGAYDHKLKKIKATSGEIVWEYEFDDVVKGTGTIWVNKKADNLRDKYVILQGSRLGVGNFLDSKHIPSYRAISYFSGEELWRLDSKWMDSYSRDVDGSALIINDTAYIGLENSLFTVFDPDYQNARWIDSMLQPKIIQERQLYLKKDVLDHKYNVVTESSPSLLNDHIYIASGSGHVWGYNLKTKELDWDYYIGSDLDGSAIVTGDSCILISVEKQYIKGKGGVLKLNPLNKPEDAAVWFFPVENNDFVSWEGGVIGSVGINDRYVSKESVRLAAFSGIDGYLYVVDHESLIKDFLVPGPDSVTTFSTPKLVYKHQIGPSISTPIFTKNRLIAASYNGVFLFSYDQELNFKLLDVWKSSFEATPIVYNRVIYIASRDGYLYCFGEMNKNP